MTGRLATLLVVATASIGCGVAPGPNLAAPDDARLAPPMTGADLEPTGPEPEPTGPEPEPERIGTATAVGSTRERPPQDDPTTTAAPARSATLAFTGDTLAHSPLWRRAQADHGGNGYDFAPMFADIAPIVSAADLAVCHLETPIAPDGEEFSTDPLYGVPLEIVSAMAGAGFDRCSTASNHALDRYGRGIDRTIEVLESNGMGQTGMARNQSEALPSVFVVNGIAMTHLSYTYATNGIPPPDGEPWRTNYIDAPRIVADARAARELGAEFVFASMHWGTEGVEAPNDQQRAIAEAITVDGHVDLVVGHHAHVLQPIEQLNDVWVAYGLGNILSNLPVNDSWPASTQDAAVVEFAITVDGSGLVTVDRPLVHPTWVDKNNGWVIRDVDASLTDPTIGDGRRGELERSRDRTADVLGAYLVR